MASHSIEHTWVCHFWFHLISTLPSGWWPRSPPGNLHTGSHGYPQFSDRRLLRADGRWLWVRHRLGDMGVAQHSAASFSPPPSTLNTDIHTHTHTHTHTQKRFSLDPAWFGPWQRTHDISNITNATTMLTFIEYQSSASHWLMKHLAYEGKEIPYQNSLSSVFLTQFKHDYLDQVFLWLMWLLMCLWIISEAYWNFKFLGPNWKMQIQEIRHWTQDSAQGARGFQRSWSGPLERKPVLAQGCPDFGVPMESVKMQSDSGYQRRSLEILHFWLAPRWGWCCRSLEHILSNKNLNGQSPRGWFMQDLAANSPICDPMDYSLPGSSVYGISQARILE